MTKLRVRRSHVIVDVPDDELVQGSMKILEGGPLQGILGHAQGRQHLHTTRAQLPVSSAHHTNANSDTGHDSNSRMRPRDAAGKCGLDPCWNKGKRSHTTSQREEEEALRACLGQSNG